MGRSRRVGTLCAALGVGLSALVSCRTGGADATRPVQFPPGRHAVTTDGVRLELTTAAYDETGVDVRLQVKNRGAQPLVVRLRGLVLAHGDLEFPATVSGEHPLPEQTEVAPKGEATVDARFELGGRLTAQATLKLRAVERGGTWLNPITLTVPGGIDPQAQRKPRKLP